ncbi:MAG: hypothetical protein HOV81_16900 [Kofleriaceae bacterium]|nr:hypothetical protein [Kofleriaceae bacterium]
MRAIAFAFAIGLAAVACGSSGGDHDDSAAMLSIEPSTNELLIENGVFPTANYTAKLTYPNGDTRDVTSEVSFAIDSGYGGFAASTLTMTAAGKASVYATLVDKRATAQVIARLKDTRVDPSLPAGAADWFQNNPEDPARAPTVVYPPADVVMPRNLGDFEVHWTDAVGNDVFEVSLKTEFADVRAIVPGNNGAIANSSWMAFLAKEWLDAVSFDSSVQFQVRGVQSSNPTVIGPTQPQLVKLSNEDMLGGLYYWAATAQNGPYGIFRHDMSHPGQPAEQYYTTAQTGGRCVACHVLSRDGRHMAITYVGGGGPATMVDVETKAAQTETRAWNFGTFTPDGNEFLAVSNGTLAVIDYATQTTLATMPASGQVTHPDLSADGTMLVYVQKSTGGDWSFTGGKVMMRTYDVATRQFGPEQTVIADTANNYYPSFSPDGKWILFNRAAGGDAYNNGNATLWVAKAEPNALAIELVNANAGLGLTNSWGRWAPFAQTLGAANDPMYWITVSSTREFGVRLVGAARKPQIWMTPFFPNQMTSNADPSAHAFRLPFQNIDSNNHIAQWTEQIIAPQ